MCEIFNVVVNTLLMPIVGFLLSINLEPLANNLSSCINQFYSFLGCAVPW